MSQDDVLDAEDLAIAAYAALCREPFSDDIRLLERRLAVVQAWETAERAMYAAKRLAMRLDRRKPSVQD